VEWRHLEISPIVNFELAKWTYEYRDRGIVDSSADAFQSNEHWNNRLIPVLTLLNHSKLTYAELFQSGNTQKTTEIDILGMLLEVNNKSSEVQFWNLGKTFLINVFHVFEN